MKYLLVDLDHTISDAAWRDSLFPEDQINGDWHIYHSNLVADDPLETMAELVAIMKLGSWVPIAITARPERYRDITMKWLQDWRIPIDEILMNPREKWERSCSLKEEIFIKRFPRWEMHKFILIDDHPEVCSSFRNRFKMTVLQVHK